MSLRIGIGTNLKITPSVIIDPAIPIINDGHTVGWYKPLDTGGAVRDGAGKESIYWDMIYGSNSLGSELSVGNIVLYAVYKITACQVNYFYAGCLVGDTFICAVVKALNANNKVQRYTGNHLTQPTAANQPTNQLFDGVTSFMKTAPITWIQPEKIYMVLKHITWTASDCIMDGAADSSMYLQQFTATPKTRMYAAASLFTPDMTLNIWYVLRMLFNGVNSKAQLNVGVATTGNVGATNASGFTLGRQGATASGYGHFQIAEIILRNLEDSANEDIINNYLKSTWGI